MSIEFAQDLIGLQRAAAITRKPIEAMKAAARAGISTRELDNNGGEVMRQLGARSAPKLVYKFPGENCISVWGSPEARLTLHLPQPTQALGRNACRSPDFRGKARFGAKRHHLVKHDRRINCTRVH